MPGAEGRAGFPWDSLPWQFNWGLIILEVSPYLILIGAIILGSLIGRMRVNRNQRGVVENIAGVVQENNGPMPYVLIGLYIIIAATVLIYTFNNGIFGNNY